jgi:CheY-like chemotaxis protein
MVADPTRLQQIVWNLLTNAVKFTPRGGTVTLSARRTTSHVQVTVSDTGEGIDPSFLPHVFEAFRQAENPSTRVHGGLGLGLSIVRYLVEAHGGTISVESLGRGHGAAFNVTLPIAAVVPAVAAHSIAASAALPPPQRLDGVTILLIDDDREGRRVIAAILRQSGADVTPAESAFVALESLKTMQPDVVVTDIAMPQLDGYAFARQLRVERPGQKIIALTAFPAGPAGIQDNVFDAYIMKPVEPRVLADSIHRVLGRQKN